MTGSEIADPANASVVRGLLRYCGQHGIKDTDGFLKSEVRLLSGKWGPAAEFVRAGMYHGVELDGSIHT